MGYWSRFTSASPAFLGPDNYLSLIICCCILMVFSFIDYFHWLNTAQRIMAKRIRNNHYSAYGRLLDGFSILGLILPYREIITIFILLDTTIMVCVVKVVNYC